MPGLAQAPKIDMDVEALAAICEIINDFGPEMTKAAILASPLGEELGSTRSEQDYLRLIQYLIRQFYAAPNTALELEIGALASGIELADQAGCRKTARRWGLTPAAISKRVIAWAEKNHLQPSRYMRSLKDRGTYALTNQPRMKS